jgi:phosphatidylethanolamine-binding protein (PEBP) family uncharacterized protein
MRARAMATLAGPVLLAAFALAGCGGSSGKPTLHAISVGFRSPGVHKRVLSATYTCDGKNISPPLEWGQVPATTRSLAMFVIGIVPTAKGGYKYSVEWAVAGINPALHRIAAGRLPAGAYLGRASNGKSAYDVCPGKGKAQLYEFTLYGVPRTIGIPKNFQGLELLHYIASPESSYGTRVGGSFLALYKRRA